MAAGLGFKTFTTGEVLTAADTNGYLMQGINVFASTAARNAAITSPQEGQFAFTKDTNSLWYYDGAAWVASGATGDIEGVTAGVGITGGGTSGTVTITNDMATTITAAGDIVVGTGSGTYDNLPIGTTAQVLTADTTVSPYKVKWATASSGSMTSLATGSLTGSTPSISSISGSYKHLQLFVTDPYGSGANIINMRFNSDTGSNYTRQKINGNATPTVASESATSITSGNGILTTSNGNGYFVIYLPFYSTTASAKHFDWYFTRAGNSDANEYIYGTYNSSSAISSIQFFLDGGSTFTGGDYTLYGVN